MPELTQEELECITEILTRERLMVKKCKLYSRLCHDPQLRTKCEQAAAKHQNHWNDLLPRLLRKEAEDG